MATMAMDVITIMDALHTLEKEHLGYDRAWGTYNNTQGWFFELYARFKGLVGQLHNLKAKASVDWLVLNEFLTANGFDPMFDEPLDGIGAVSILDMLVEWLYQASLCNIHGKDGKTHDGFAIPAEGVEFFKVGTFEHPLARLKTKSGDSLWLMMFDALSSPADLVKFAFMVMDLQHSRTARYAGAELPMVDFNLKPDISWLEGADTTEDDGTPWYIYQASQQFKFRMNEEGARAKVASGVGVRKCAIGPGPLHFNQPFAGWFTQDSIAPVLPIAVFYAGSDSWKKAGSIHNL